MHGRPGLRYEVLLVAWMGVESEAVEFLVHLNELIVFGGSSSVAVVHRLDLTHAWRQHGRMAVA